MQTRGGQHRRLPEHASRTTVLRTGKLNAALHRALARRSGISVANCVGRNGYFYRDDPAGPNLSTKSTAILELGNMRNGGDQASRAPPRRIRIAGEVARGSWSTSRADCSGRGLAGCAM